MPSRRSRRIVGSVVRTTTKLVEETVEVAVVERESQDLTQEPQTAETTAAGGSSGGEEFRRSIPAEDKTPPPERPRTMPMSEDLESTKRADSSSQITNDTDATPKIETEVGDGDLAGGEGMKSRKKKEQTKNQGKRRQISKSSRGGGGREGYKRYVFRVLKQVHPEMGITGRAMVILNNLMNDMFERLAEEATKLSKYTGRMTLSSREIQGAVRLVLPGELGKHAIAEGTKALSSYVSYDHMKTPQP